MKLRAIDIAEYAHPLAPHSAVTQPAIYFLKQEKRISISFQYAGRGQVIRLEQLAHRSRIKAIAAVGVHVDNLQTSVRKTIARRFRKKASFAYRNGLFERVHQHKKFADNNNLAVHRVRGTFACVI